MIIEVEFNKKISNISIPGMLIRNCGKFLRLEISPMVVKRLGVAEVLRAIYDGIGTEGVIWIEY